jgi:DNA-binding GntR family transcriptional regulator
MAERTQAELAYKELTRRMLTLEIPPNERLKEEEWARKLGVSRSAIRESLTRLQGEGMVQPGSRGGFFVSEMSEQDVHEIRELREVLEVAAFSLACDRPNPEALNELEEACNDFSTMFQKGYYTGACEADLRFHRLLVAASGNSRLSQVYQRSNIPLFHMKLGRSRVYMEDFAETEGEHRKILAALRNVEKKRGIELLRSHFARGEKAVISTNGPA